MFVDSHENIWVGSPIGLTRIDGKSGEYSLFRQGGPGPASLSNSFVASMVEDRAGYLWIGTYGGGLNRYDPRTRRFTVFRHNPADPESLSHDIVYSLMVDHQGTLWAGTGDGLNRCEDPATGRFRSWKAGPAVRHRRKSLGLLKIPRAYCGWPAGRFSASIRRRVASPLTGSIPPEREKRTRKVPRLSSVGNEERE